MKRVYIIVLAVLVVLISVLFANYFVYKPEAVSICDVLGIVKAECKENENECKKMVKNREGLIDCLGSSLSLVDLNASRQICSLQESEDHQKFCFAQALFRVSVENATKQCDLIEENTTRIHCHCDILVNTNRTDEALKECETLKDLNQMYFCKARIVTPEEAIVYCNKIIDSKTRQECLELYGSS
jgi:hypothetical protein